MLPEVDDVPLISDSSSDIFSGPIDVARHGLIYAGAQKNMGPAGVTVVIIREDLLQRSIEKKSTLPTMFNYSVHAENRSLYNTPPVFAVYALGLVMKWLIRRGGLAAMSEANERKAVKLYAEIDRTGFYRGTAATSDRSRMNVTFRLTTEDLEKLFVKESTAAGLDGLKGHRSVGGMRASIYNAFSRGGHRRARRFHAQFRADARVRCDRVTCSSTSRIRPEKGMSRCLSHSVCASWWLSS